MAKEINQTVWHSTKYVLPKESGRYLCSLDNGRYVCIVFFDGKEFDESVTHWTILPTPPKG